MLTIVIEQKKICLFKIEMDRLIILNQTLFLNTYNIRIQYYSYYMYHIHILNSSFFPKIYERLMYTNVFNFMNEKELIYKYQFGFSKKNTQHNKQ